ncbi:methylated-DNA--[protein]-cysteine S-methyltransferase [Patescibacteria group bacterium]|nr:methylated-DNA--[protein]-cysteine S-methyltransferase [Patescibacteria group bacterium]
MDHYTSIKKVVEHIVENKLQARSLEEIAASMQMSPGYLQKLFTEWVGITPKQFGRYLSVEYAKELLRQNQNTMQATIHSGLSSSGRLHDLFVDIEAMTPGEYQKRGATLTINYSTFETKFGLCLVASTERGICNILFFENPKDGLRELTSLWPKANIVHKIEPLHEALRDYFSNLTSQSKIKLHLQGTNFQIKVWEALLSIPEGTIATYGEIARKLGSPNQSRAVGAAVGDNPISYLIPCHRVLKSTGEISGYRWGVSRKRVMLAYEAMQKETA